jgi:CPA2 family monovalent cation:H+ antiporter-2
MAFILNQINILMMVEPLHLDVVIILTIGFTLASLLGYLTQRIKLSPILGYLLAGYVIGPFFPGFVADLKLAEQLAEVGVMLMMFGVGLHFKWQELVSVKKIAVPGAIVQTLAAVLIAALFVYYIWGSWEVGVIIGLAIGVASTVVLVRVLADNNLLNTLQGHIAVGWLIVEDILTVAVLILLPTIVALLTGASISIQEILMAIILVLFKFILLAAIMFTLGRRFVSYALFKIARTRSPELFTLAVLALTFLIATGSALLFGTSIALGAFIAGMVIGQTDVRHQASAYASPMKDAFVVIFFLSVGMLFNPIAIIDNFSLFLSILMIILIVKPLVAFLIVILMRYSLMVALSIAFALAQIGEFSFILAEEASHYQVFPDQGFDIIVACALISISVNPLLFKALDYWKPYLAEQESFAMQQNVQQLPKQVLRALVIGFGSIGQSIVAMLEKLGYRPIIIERDVDAVAKLVEEQREAVYGEASFPNMLKMAHVELADLLIITGLNLVETLNIIQYAHEIHPEILIVARAQNIEEQDILNQMGIKVICNEVEITQAFNRILTEIAKETL